MKNIKTIRGTVLKVDRFDFNDNKWFVDDMPPFFNTHIQTQSGQVVVVGCKNKKDVDENVAINVFENNDKFLEEYVATNRVSTIPQMLLMLLLIVTVGLGGYYTQHFSFQESFVKNHFLISGILCIVGAIAEYLFTKIMSKRAGHIDGINIKGQILHIKEFDTSRIPRKYGRSNNQILSTFVPVIRYKYKGRIREAIGNTQTAVKPKLGSYYDLIINKDTGDIILQGKSHSAIPNAVCIMLGSLAIFGWFMLTK